MTTTQQAQQAPARDISATAMAFQTIATDTERRIIEVGPDAIASAEKMVDLTSSEWVEFGPYPSLLTASGIIDADLGNVLHRIHTNWHGDATLGEKYSFMVAMNDLLPKLF